MNVDEEDIIKEDFKKAQLLYMRIHREGYRASPMDDVFFALCLIYVRMLRSGGEKLR